MTGRQVQWGCTFSINNIHKPRKSPENPCQYHDRPNIPPNFNKQSLELGWKTYQDKATCDLRAVERMAFKQSE